jgi:hypothetical protein
MVTFWTFSYRWIIVTLTSNKNSFQEGGGKKNSVKTLMFNLMYSTITASDMAAGIFSGRIFSIPLVSEKQ